MTKKPRDKVILIGSRDRVTKESLLEKLILITTAYGRARAREDYVKVRALSEEEQKRGFWRNDDLIFLEHEIQAMCARLCSEWTDHLEEVVRELIRDHLTEEDDEEK